MAQGPSHTASPLAGGSSDIFLMVKGARSGVIKGEAQDSAHPQEIDIVSWTWGMQARAALGGGGATGKATVHELKVVKRVDSASTALMSALRSNELIAKAVLTQRKAGKSQLEFLKVTIEQGRVTALTIEAGSDSSNTPDIFEQVSFSFNKITVEYVPQGKDGQATGGMMYTDEFGDQS
jgi:type VI secretion system secreted protein Hcp